MKSQFKYKGGYGLLILLNLIAGIGTFYLLVFSNINLAKVDLVNDSGAQVFYTLFLGVSILFFLLLISQAKQIFIETQTIIFVNPIFPFIKKTYRWEDFDYLIEVDEQSEEKTYEAVWLIKNQKVEKRISSFYYNNYPDIKNRLQIENRGNREFSIFSEVFTSMGWKKLKT